MFDLLDRISIAQIVFFALCFLPAQYILFKHGTKAMLGWLFLCIFCVIRIVGASIIIHDESGGNPVSEAGLIISSVAIAPMIIALSAISHESFGSISSVRSFLFGFAPGVIVHVVTIGAIVMMVVGFIMFDTTSNSASDRKTGIDLIRAGSVVLLLVWALMTVVMAASYRYRRSFRGEKQLAAAVSIALICLLVRIIYLLLEAFLNSRSFSLVNGGTVAEHAVLDVLPEFILMLVLLTAGFTSRNLRTESEVSAGGRRPNGAGVEAELLEDGYCV